MSGPVSYRTFDLTAPESLIIDLHDTQLNADLDSLALEHSPVSAIRSGSNGKDTPLVLDLQPRNHSNTAVPAQGDAPPLRSSGQRDIIVVIDAGHGGNDPGAVAASSEREETIALVIASQLTRKINAQRGFKARLARNEDIFIPLRKRVEIARRHNADMFISVHADAAPRRPASGASVFAAQPQRLRAGWRGEKTRSI